VNERLAVVVPVYNEEATLEAVIEVWRGVFDPLGIEREFLVVDDGSTDGTGAVLRALAARHASEIAVIEQPNAGHGAACRAGYERAAGGEAGWVLQIDSDGQCDPTAFPRFWELRARCDCVFGRRISRGDGWARAVVSRACSAVAAALARRAAGDVNVPYRLMRREALARALDRIPRGFALQNIALTVTLGRMAGLRWAWIPIHFLPRAGGQNKMNLARIARLGWTLLRQWRGLRG
jgi:glycosyltransferase involved in cell wall biosynthesis